LRAFAAVVVYAAIFDLARRGRPPSGLSSACQAAAFRR
jgi:hypothetical protein